MNKGEAMSLIPYWNKLDDNRQSKNNCENGELAGASRLHKKWSLLVFARRNAELLLKCNGEMGRSTESSQHGYL